MSKRKLSTEQIIGVLKQLEAGRTTADLAREVGVSKHTIYAWKAQFGGMEVNEAEELRTLRDENQRLKKLVADLSLDKEMLKSLIAKNVWSAAGLQEQNQMKRVCVNVSGLLCGQKALATMRMRAHPAS
jgi:putative transposase